MSKRTTGFRVLHDLGAGAWFGGSLMGAVGLNQASGIVSDPQDRAPVASAGWAAWSPVNAAAIGAHVIGGLGLLQANRGRVKHQSGTRANTVVKTALTGAALGATAYSGVLGARVASAGRVPTEAGTRPSEGTPTTVASAQQQLRVVQWAIPVLTGTLVALGAQQGEQQRAGQVARGFLARVGPTR
ncbi:hypothetical protein [Serinicoccus chungangensis]|uniref:hypothetical protein n=1 Tax=Serinicoccus chungangensis TaxID=767452 RepID=UPI0011184D86|nr:hypothetical protein [Serinicoccus chungangensis]